MARPRPAISPRIYSPWFAASPRATANSSPCSDNSTRSTGNCSPNTARSTPMGRSKQAPSSFECPYRHACPHLGGLSTTWATELLRDAEQDSFRDSHFAGAAADELAALQGDVD